MDYFSEHNYNISVREGKTTALINDVYTDKSILGIVTLTDLNKSFFDRYFISKALTFIPRTSITQHISLRKEPSLSQLKFIELEQLKDYLYLTYQQDDVLFHFAEEVVHIDQIKQIVYVKDRDAINDLSISFDKFIKR